MKTKTSNTIKRAVDVILTILLLFLTAYQVTGEMLHEWFGIAMTVLLIVHHVQNRKWYGALFKGKYNPYRITLTAVNTLLLLSIAMTALSGMSMSCHAVPFMYGFIDVMTARCLHLAMSYWTFIFMGVHIGLHIRTMTAKLGEKKTMILNIVFTILSGAGLCLFLRAGIVNYILFRTHFAFLDYETPKWLVIFENLAMLLFWALIGYTAALISQKKGEKYTAKPLLLPTAAVFIGVLLYLA